MAGLKRNEYLDAEDSQEEGSAYDSEAGQNSKISRTVKRRKLSDIQDEKSLSEGESGSEDEADRLPKPIPESRKSGRNLPPKQANINGQGEKEPSQRKMDAKREERSPMKVNGTSRTAPLLRKQKNKTGVIYLSRVPPFMKPATVRHLLSPYGEVSRIFLTPESPTSHSTRVRHGGNKKRSFVDGWVEFVHKSDAKLVAETLNANIIGGKKGHYYHDDVWNIKYLRGFKWADLTEQIKNENAERAARLRMEISQTTRENKRFLESVERAKMLERMQAKRKNRQDDGPAMPEPDSLDLDSKSRNSRGASRANSVSNIAPRSDSKKPKKSKQQPENVQSVLDMIL